MQNELVVMFIISPKLNNIIKRPSYYCDLSVNFYILFDITTQTNEGWITLSVGPNRSSLVVGEACFFMWHRENNEFLNDSLAVRLPQLPVFQIFQCYVLIKVHIIFYTTKILLEFLHHRIYYAKHPYSINPENM